MKIIFLYHSPHYLHKEWAEVAGAKSLPFVPRIVERLRLSKPCINQPLGLLNGFLIPKANIYLVEGPSALLPAIVKKWLNKKVKIIMINSDMFFYRYNRSNKLIKKIYRKYLSYVDALISTSNFMRSLSGKYVNVPNSIVFPYVDFDKYDSLNVNLNSANIGLIGNVARFRGTDLLLSAYLEIKKKYGSKLFLIGRKAENIDIVEKSLRLNKNSIKLTGRVTDPSKFIEKCGLYVNPARHESFGINILEAMATGLPPIVSVNCGAAEVVSKVSKKLIVDLNVDEIIERLIWLQENKKIKKELSSSCKKVARNFTKNNSMRSFKKEFSELVRQLS